MNRIILFVTLFLYTLSFAQKHQKGFVQNQNNLIEGVDVINLTTKVQTQTDPKGEFTIFINVGDTLVFYKKNYVTLQLYITAKKPNLIYLEIKLEQIVVELDEVIVTQLKVPEFKTQDIMNIQYTDDWKSSPKNELMYNANQGGNVFGLISKLISLIAPKKSAESIKTSKRTLRESIVLNLDNDFLTKKLQLKPEEIEPFIIYCEFDDESEQIAENNDVLELIGFLIDKHFEFKKANE